MSECAAQIIGVSIGGTFNYSEPDVSNRATTKANPGFGYMIQTEFEFHIFEKLSIKTGLSVLTKNYSINRTGSLSGAFIRFKNSYLQLPINLNFPFLKMKKLCLSINTGIYFSYWIASKHIGAVHNVFNSFSTINDSGQVVQNINLTTFNSRYNFTSHDSRWEDGICTGLSLKYHSMDKYQLILSISYYNSLNLTDHKDSVASTANINRTIIISLGGAIDLYH